MGRFGPGYKIAGGHAYYNDAGEDVESDDPFAICSGVLHGTHVAGKFYLYENGELLRLIPPGIIGMQDPTTSGFGLLGVAPEASIYAYRVFPCDNGAPFDTILKALEKAADDGMDLVTMSLGSLGQFASIDPFEAITSSLVAHGIAVFAAGQ
jgi:subtilisin family serine protease